MRPPCSIWPAPPLVSSRNSSFLLGVPVGVSWLGRRWLQLLLSVVTALAVWLAVAAWRVGGGVGIAALLATFVMSAISNTRLLYQREPLPKASEMSETAERAQHRVNGVNEGARILTS